MSDVLTGEAQARVTRLLEELVAEGNDVGLQVAVYHRGKLVVDAWAGRVDADPASPSVDGSTLFPVFSCGKGMAATVVHMLAERGKLNYDTPIAHYWPEFAAHGKQSITLRHALNHTAGLYQMPHCEHVTDLCDWDGMCRRIADLAPMLTPGTQQWYHAITYGWLVGEPARRVDGREFAQIVRDEIARPLGIESDMHFGIPENVQPRVATLQPLRNFALPETEDPAIPNWVRPMEDLMNNHAVRRGSFPATGGIMSARSLARHYAALLPGGVDGVEFLSPQTIHYATQLPDLPPDKLGVRGLGYMLRGPESDPGLAFGHGGYGGSIGYADLEHQLAMGVTKNVMDSPRDAREEVTRVVVEWLNG